MDSARAALAGRPPSGPRCRGVRAPRARPFDRAGPRGAGRHRGPARRHPRRERGVERTRQSALGVLHSRRREARHLHGDGRGHAGAPDRVRERRQPAARAGHGSRSRNVDPRGHRRGPRPHRPPAAHGERAAGSGECAAWRGAHLRRRGRFARRRASRRHPLPDRVPGGRPDPRLHRPGQRGHRYRVRVGSGGARRPRQLVPGAARGRPHRRGQRPQPRTQHAGRRRSRRLHRPAGRRRALHAQLPQPPARRDRVRYGRRHDRPFLHAGGQLCGRGREVAACAGHPAPPRGSARCHRRGGFEPDPARRRRRGQPCPGAGQELRDGQGAQALLRGRHGALPAGGRGDAAARPVVHRARGRDACDGGRGQRHHGPFATGRRRGRRVIADRGARSPGGRRRAGSSSIRWGVSSGCSRIRAARRSP